LEPVNMSTSANLKDGGLLFINQDEKTLSKNKHMNRKLRAHIMRDFARKKSLASIQRLKKDVSAVDQFMRRKPKNGNAPDDGTEKLGGASIPIRDSRQQRTPTSDEYSSAIAQHDEEVQRITMNEAQNLIVRQKANPISPLHLHNGGSGDPFFSSAIELDPSRSGLFQYFVVVLIPFLAGREGAAVRVKTVALAEVQTSLADSEEMWSILAMASAHQEALRRAAAPWHVVSHEKSSLYYQTRCIQAIQRSLAAGHGNVGEGTIRAVTRVSYAESISGNYASQIVHQRASFELVTLRGGLETLDERMQEKFAMMDVKMATISLAKPYFPLIWSPGDLSEETKAKILPIHEPDLMALGDRLLLPELQTSSVMHPAVREIFKDLRDVVHLAEFVATNANDTDWSDLRWMTYRTLAVEHRLLSMAYNAVLQAATPDPAIQSCVRIATLIYTNTTLLNNIPTHHLRRIIPALISALGKTELDVFWSPFADLLLWVLCMGAFVAETTEMEPWFVEWMAKTASFLLIAEWEEVGGLLREFFYLRKVHETAMERIWGRVKVRLETLSPGA
jgi:hypothetical protein